jgi:L-proline---[L-prolyl-carrier protein] ligase
MTAAAMSPSTLPDCLEASAARWPARTAVVDPGGRHLTFAELHQQADALARFLTSRGVTRGDRIAVVLPKSLAAVVALFGVMKAGAAYVPVDVLAPRERKHRILADCQVRAIVIDGRTLTELAGDNDASGSLADLVVVAGASSDDPPLRSATSFELALKCEESIPRDAASPDDLAYILYTSGSTGMPKGVMITHGNVLAFLESCSAEFRPTEEDRFANHAPFHFDPSVFDLYLAIKHGASVHLISEEIARNPRELARFVASHRLTIWCSTPTPLVMLARFGSLEACDTSSLRLVLFGGEVFPPQHLRTLQRYWSSPAYYNVYGPTETTVACTFGRVPSAVPPNRQTPYPIGFPCAHCRALVLDEHLDEADPGSEGVLYVSGRSVFTGYWNRPAESASAFLNRDGVRWYNTGDVVRWDSSDGLIYVGRNDRMIKRRGYRIELGEIEAALTLFPHVVDAAAIAGPATDGGVTIVAFLSFDGDTRPSAVELKTFCAAKLPAYMTPDRFVVMERLPRTSTDKIDYQALVSALLAPSPHALTPCDV